MCVLMRGNIEPHRHSCRCTDSWCGHSQQYYALRCKYCTKMQQNIFVWIRDDANVNTEVLFKKNRSNIFDRGYAVVLSSSQRAQYQNLVMPLFLLQPVSTMMRPLALHQNISGTLSCEWVRVNHHERWHRQQARAGIGEQRRACWLGGSHERGRQPFNPS